MPHDCAKWNRDRNARLRAEGKCIQCREPNSNGRMRCRACSDLNYSKDKRFRLRPVLAAGDSPSLAASAGRIMPIAGWEGYWAREDGAILSDRCKRLRGFRQKKRVVIDPLRRHELKTTLNKRTGYLCVRLTVNQRSKTVVVHGLVLEAFTGGRPPGKEVRHLDGNRLNNALSNLAWGTHVENESDKDRHGTRMLGDGHSNSKLTTAKVREIRRRISTGERQDEIAATLGVHKATINDVHKRKTWRHVK